MTATAKKSATEGRPRYHETKAMTIARFERERESLERAQERLRLERDMMAINTESRRSYGAQIGAYTRRINELNAAIERERETVRVRDL